MNCIGDWVVEVTMRKKLKYVSSTYLLGLLPESDLMFLELVSDLGVI